MGNNTLRENVRCFYHNPTKKETWRLIISNSCGPDTVFATIDTLKAFKGPIDTLVMPSYLCDATNHEWVVNYLNRKNPNSRYNINEYKLSMITRWGGVNLLAWEKSNSGFTQGHIKITKEQLGKFASLGYTNLILLEIRKCDPATYKEVGLYDVKRNVRNVIPVIFGR